MPIGLQDYIVEETTAEWILYHNDFSLCSRKVRICLHETGLDYESKHIDLIETGKYEVASKEFLKINPGATVPVLLHYGRPIYESHEQIKYILNHKRSNKIREQNNTQIEIEYWTEKASMVGNPVREHKKYAGNTIGPLTFPLFETMLGYVSIVEILKGLIRHPIKQRVVIFLMLKMFGINFLKLPPIKNLMLSAFNDLNSHIDELESKLSSSNEKWLIGDNFTIADISWSVILHRLEECGWSTLLLKNKPFVKAYFAELKKRPSFLKGITDRSNPNLKKGVSDLKNNIEHNLFLKSIHKKLDEYIQ
jgi:glutathione S-transferase